MICEKQAKKYCRDNLSRVENYEKAIADKTQTWQIHHRLELTLDGEFAHSTDELKRLGMYFDRPYFELIFLTPSEHCRLHNICANNPNYGKIRSAETRKKIAGALKGIHRSDETKRRISQVTKSRPFTEEHKRKMSEAMKRRWSRLRNQESNFS